MEYNPNENINTQQPQEPATAQTQEPATQQPQQPVYQQPQQPVYNQPQQPVYQQPQQSAYYQQQPPVYYAQPQYNAPVATGSAGGPVTSFILSMFSIVLCAFGFYAFVLAIPSFIVSITSVCKRSVRARGLAIAGLIISCFVLFFCFVFFITLIAENDLEDYLEDPLDYMF